MSQFFSPQSVHRFVILYFLTISAIVAQVPTNWKKVSPIGFERLLDVGYGDGKWAAVSGDGVQLTSQNGTTWTPGDHEQLSTGLIAYGGGAWIAGFQHLWRSEDLATWTQVLNNGATGVTFAALHYANGLWVATGGEAIGGRTGKIFTSSDGISWEEQFSEDGSYFCGVHYADGKWLAVSDQFAPVLSPLSFVYQSSDGTNWTKLGEVSVLGRGSSGRECDIAFGNDQWLISGRSLHSSSDGMTWTKVEVADFVPTHVRFADGRWVGVGLKDMIEDFIVTSSDGLNWSAVTAPYEETLNRIHYDNSQWIAVGNHGLILESADAMTWTEVSNRQGVPANLDQVQFADGLWSARGTGPGGVYVSSDGQIWEPQLQLDIAVEELVIGNGIRFGITFSFEGERGFVVSTDGETWTEHENTNRIREVAVGQGKFLGIVDNFLYSSTDGIAWTQVDVPQFEDLDFIFTIGFANNLWLLGAEDDDEECLVFSSTDGTTWKVLNEPGELDVQAAPLTYGEGTWITTNLNGTRLLASTDGETWTERLVVPDDPSLEIISITYGNGSWLAFQFDGLGVFSSDDGMTWTEQVIEENSYFNDGHFANDLWVAVGMRGAIFVGGDGLPQDLPLPPLFISRDGESVTLTWTPNQPGLTLEASPSLREADFSAVLNQPSAGENGIVDYLVSGNDSLRFFRLRR